MQPSVVGAMVGPMKTLLPVSAAVLLSVTSLVGCAQTQEPPGILLGEAWVRTTEGKEMPDMTAVYVNMSNPGSELVHLTSADCGDVAAQTELHEMVMEDGQMVMQRTEAIPVPAEGHQHLAPGGPHIMIMGLTRELPVGGEEITCTMGFDNGQELEFTAPVKEFTEEQETYHEHKDMDYGQDEG